MNPASWNPSEPEEFRSLRFKHALQANKCSCARWAARNKLTYYEVFKALAFPAEAPKIIKAIDAYIGKHLRQSAQETA